LGKITVPEEEVLVLRRKYSVLRRKYCAGRKRLAHAQGHQVGHGGDGGDVPSGIVAVQIPAAIQGMRSKHRG